MKNTIIAARKALIATCISAGVEDPAQIRAIATSVAKSCGKMQVAGVKAWVKHPKAFAR